MNRLLTRWRREQFDPTWLGVFVNPFFHARRGLMCGLRPKLSELRGDIIDIGCGRKPYRDLTAASNYVGLDIDSDVTRSLAAADVFYDGHRIPFPDGSFDGALCSQVFEHVFWPQSFVMEIHRVLRPGGRLVLTVPFVWDEHEQPYDFARYSSFGLQSVLREAGFEIVSHNKATDDFRCITQLASGWIYKVTRSKSRIRNLLAQFALIAPINLAGGLIALLLPRNPDLFLDNIVVAQRHVRLE